MPFHSKSNNRVLPANQRAVSVAKRALEEIIPIQQRRYANAFEVQGYECLVYNHLTQGYPCSCQANRKVFSGLLDQEGKMPAGHMNELLTGGLPFSVNAYGARDSGVEELRPIRGMDEFSRDNQRFGELTTEKPLVFEVDGELEDPYVTVTNPEGTTSLDDAMSTFDTDLLDTYTKCGVCFGGGFIGGFSVLGGWRRVLTPSNDQYEVEKIEGTIEVNRQPHAFNSTKVVFNVVLPRGFKYLDAFKLWDNTEQVFAELIELDGIPFSEDLFAALCDGRAHRITVTFPELTMWTHLELQVGQTDTPGKIEFPRLTNGTDLTRVDGTEDIQINASPMIPRLMTKDVIVESTFGKTFIIGSCNLWNTKSRNGLGWDASARVIQHEEILSHLPRRRRLNSQTTNAVRDNADGIRRT